MPWSLGLCHFANSGPAREAFPAELDLPLLKVAEQGGDGQQGDEQKHEAVEDEAGDGEAAFAARVEDAEDAGDEAEEHDANEAGEHEDGDARCDGRRGAGGGFS